LITLQRPPWKSCRCCRSRSSGSGSSTGCSPTTRSTTSRRRWTWRDGSMCRCWPRRSPKSCDATERCARRSERWRASRRRGSRPAERPPCR